MSKQDGASDLFENLRLVYSSYGGWKSFRRSGYTRLAVVITALMWRSAADGGWSEFALSVMPTLAGFSIAVYALLLAVMPERLRDSLMRPEEALDGRSPMLVMASSVSHALVIQIAAIIVAAVYVAEPFPTPYVFVELAFAINLSVSLFGTFLAAYGIMLVLAGVLSIFRVLHSQVPKSDESQTKKPGN